MNIDPELPLADLPDPTLSTPLSPTADVPVLNINNPLAPLVPLFAVPNIKLPLDVLDPYPLITHKRPPLASPDVLVPADNTNSPPAPLTPDPTVT